MCTSHTHPQFSPFRFQDLTCMHTCWDLHRIPRIKTRKPVSKTRPCVGRGKKPQGAMEPSSKEEHQTKAGLQSLQGHLGRLGGSPKEVQCITDTEQFLAAGAEMHPNVCPVPGLQVKRSQLLSLQNSSGCFQSGSTVPVLPCHLPFILTTCFYVISNDVTSVEKLKYHE